MAYVETINLDGETYLKNKVAIRDMQDAILSPADASSINGHICCDHPDDFLYNFDGMMTIKVKNSEDSLKFPLSYNQFLMRGTSLKSTNWIYGIVVYTGQETKLYQNQMKKKSIIAKSSSIDRYTSVLIKCLISIQVVLAIIASYFEVEFEHDNLQQMQSIMSPDGTGGLKLYSYLISSNFPQISYVVKFGNWMLLLM